MTWAEQYVAIEERRAYLRARDCPLADDIVGGAVLDARLHGLDVVDAVRAAVNEALLDG